MSHPPLFFLFLLCRTPPKIKDNNFSPMEDSQAQGRDPQEPTAAKPAVSFFGVAGGEDAEPPHILGTHTHEHRFAACESEDEEEEGEFPSIGGGETYPKQGIFGDRNELPSPPLRGF